MHISCSGTARIKHATTGEIYEILSDQLHWDCESNGERQMGDELRHFAELEHADLGSLTWEVFEYPTGAFNHQNAEVGNHEILDDFDITLEHEPD